MIHDLRINGEGHTIEAEPLTSLANVLRDIVGLRGTKIGCGNGECGACTVLLDQRAVCSCLYPVARAGGKDITTVEGLARDGTLSALQEAFVAFGAMQCGFCTGGMLMSAHALLMRNECPGEDDILAALAGNVCRCTGYRPIVDAVLSVSGIVERDQCSAK